MNFKELSQLVHNIMIVNINIRSEIVREKKKVVNKTQAGDADGDWMLLYID